MIFLPLLKFAILALSLLVFWNREVHGQELYVHSDFSQEDQALEFYSKQIFAPNPLLPPVQMKRQKELLKEWNPHIADWTLVGGWTSMYNRLQKYYVDVGLEKSAVSSVERNFVGEVDYTATSSDLNVSIMFPFHPKLFVEAKGLFRQYDDVSQAGLDFQLQNGYDLGVLGHWKHGERETVGAGFGHRRSQFVGLKNSAVTASAEVGDNLSKQTNSMWWSSVVWQRATTIFDQPGRLSLKGVYGLSVERQLATGEAQEEEFIEASASYRHYLYRNFWMEVQASYARQQATFSQIEHLGRQLSLGLYF